MKRRMVEGLLVVMMAMALGGCGKKVECGWCGEVKKCEEKKIFDEKIYICKDCLKELENEFK